MAKTKKGDRINSLSSNSSLKNYLMKQTKTDLIQYITDLEYAALGLSDMNDALRETIVDSVAKRKVLRTQKHIALALCVLLLIAIIL